jgi:two-component system CheB/CheR fusion protein
MYKKRRNLPGSQGLIKRQKKPSGVKLSSTSWFPIVGIGASAGGLEAFEQLFRLIAPDSAMAFVLVSHLDPNHESMLTEILQRATKMVVVEALDQMVVEPNHIYVIPPNQDMAIFHGTLQLSVPLEPKGQRLPINFFFRSLADDQGDKAICMILSGTGNDGTLGLMAIHGAGGASFVQDPSTAKYEGMPNSAVRSGLATYVLPVEKIPEQLDVYVKTVLEKKTKLFLSLPVATIALNKIMMILRSKTGNDFSLYKKSTICRRLERRMAAHNIKKHDVYLRYLRNNPQEIQLLSKEFLIKVTNFFRDQKAFAVLKKDILAQLFNSKPEDYIFRVWAPGCSTGEEVYSIAIIFREYMEDIKQEFKVQIYGTDIAEDAITFSRAGIYSTNITAEVSPERLRRFFSKEESGYRVKKDIREMVVFAVQNVIKDPPFTKLDLLSCRNLLIYLEPELQNRLIPIFHYALNPGGVLFLGPSENTGKFSDSFRPINRKWKFFQAKPDSLSIATIMTQMPLFMAQKASRASSEPEKTAKKVNFAQFIQNELLQSYVPPSVVCDEKGNIVYVYGETGKYLQPAPGRPSLNVIEMAREGLQLDLRIALRNAVMKKKSVVCSNLQVKTNGGIHGVDIFIKPIVNKEASEKLFVISFQDIVVQSQVKLVKARRDFKYTKSKHVEELEKELQLTKDELRSNSEEQQASSEELKSTNEELQSTNEELQSTNEELETSKEELQSINEELVTVNSELQSKIEQLSLVQNDMKNLLDSINIGIIFLDVNLNIKRFTQEAAKVFCLVLSDIGRALGDIKSNIGAEDLLDDAQAVLDSLLPREKEVRSSKGAYYAVRIMPYRTLENVIDGVVMTFVDISERKKAEAVVQQEREYSESIVDTVREPLVVLNSELKVVSASKSFYSTFKVSPQETVDRYLYDLGNRQWDIPKLRQLLDAVLSREMNFQDIEIKHDFPGIGHRKMLLNARSIIGKIGKASRILLAVEDITGHPDSSEDKTGGS